MKEYRILFFKNLIRINPIKTITIILSIISGFLLWVVDVPADKSFDYHIVDKFKYNGETKYVLLKSDELVIESQGDNVLVGDKLRLMYTPIWYAFFQAFSLISMGISCGIIFISLIEINDSWDIREVSKKSKMKLIKCHQEIEKGETILYYTILGRLVFKSPYPVTLNDIEYYCKNEIDMGNLNIYPEFQSTSEKRLKKISSLMD